MKKIEELKIVSWASQRKTVFRFIQFYEILEKDEAIFFRRKDCIEYGSLGNPITVYRDTENRDFGQFCLVSNTGIKRLKYRYFGI